MYALERYVLQGPLHQPQHCWSRYALCGNRALLERVRAGQPLPERWRVVYAPCVELKNARTA